MKIVFQPARTSWQKCHQLTGSTIHSINGCVRSPKRNLRVFNCHHSLSVNGLSAPNLAFICCCQMLSRNRTGWCTGSVLVIQLGFTFVAPPQLLNIYICVATATNPAFSLHLSSISLPCRRALLAITVEWGAESALVVRSFHSLYPYIKVVGTLIPSPDISIVHSYAFKYGATHPLARTQPNKTLPLRNERMIQPCWWGSSSLVWPSARDDRSNDPSHGSQIGSTTRPHWLSTLERDLARASVHRSSETPANRNSSRYPSPFSFRSELTLFRDQCFDCPQPLHNRPPSPVGTFKTPEVFRKPKGSYKSKRSG